MDKKSEIDNSTARAVGEMVQKAFEQCGGKGDSEPVILRSMNTLTKQQSRYRERVAAGLCGRCGGSRREDQKQCQTCLINSSAHYYKRIASGRCIRCRVKHETTRVRCESCQEFVNKAALERVWKNRRSPDGYRKF
jgi:hypothetical protein